MRARVEDRTLSGSWKYFDTVGREIPLTAANSSMFFILVISAGLRLAALILSGLFHNLYARQKNQ
jgi:hypothetical protein